MCNIYSTEISRTPKFAPAISAYTPSLAIKLNRVKRVWAIATGYTVSNFMDRKIGEEMAQGAVTVALHGTMKNMLGTMMPGLALSDDLLGYSEYNGLLGHDDYNDDLSAYVEGGNIDMMGAYDDNLSYSGAGYTGENPDPFDSI